MISSWVKTTGLTHLWHSVCLTVDCHLQSQVGTLWFVFSKESCTVVISAGFSPCPLLSLHHYTRECVFIRYNLCSSSPWLLHLSDVVTARKWACCLHIDNNTVTKKGNNQMQRLLGKQTKSDVRKDNCHNKIQCFTHSADFPSYFIGGIFKKKSWCMK